MKPKLALFIFLSILLLFVGGCSHKETITSSSDAQRDLQTRYQSRIGTATKTDLVQEFGPANWCRDEGTDQTCRFYKKLATVWMGQPPTDRVHRETYDELIATFDPNGVLKTVKATAQR